MSLVGVAHSGRGEGGGVPRLWRSRPPCGCPRSGGLRLWCTRARLEVAPLPRCRPRLQRPLSRCVAACGVGPIDDPLTLHFAPQGHGVMQWSSACGAGARVATAGLAPPSPRWRREQAAAEKITDQLPWCVAWASGLQRGRYVPDVFAEQGRPQISCSEVVPGGGPEALPPEVLAEQGRPLHPGSAVSRVRRPWHA